ncbi:MAG: CinA family protein [Ruminococcus sp.]
MATAESCTGGLLSQLITSVSGASRVFELGICTYAERMKTKFLGVPAELIAGKGVVSAEVAIAMAHGLRQQSDAALCLSVTGIAGPGGGTPEQPVGTVYVGMLLGRRGGCATALAVRLV